MQEQYSRFMEQGYLIIPDFISLNDCKKLMAEQNAILDNPSLIDDIKVIFDTGNQQHAKDKYFFDSARSIKLFYEKDAFNANGDLNLPIKKAVNKIGHALHDLNPIFKEFSYQAKIKNLVLSLGIKKPRIVQSMYLLKQPQVGNQVDLHQDSTFIYTTPESCIGFWFALEDATKENGCLWAIAGEHHSALRQKLIRHDNTSHMQMLDSTPFDTSLAIPLEVKAGDLIVLHGRLPHYSEYNYSLVSRHAYSLHIVDACAEYCASNWLQDNLEVPFDTCLELL